VEDKDNQHLATSASFLSRKGFFGAFFYLPVERRGELRCFRCFSALFYASLVGLMENLLLFLVMRTVLISLDEEINKATS